MYTIFKKQFLFTFAFFLVTSITFSQEGWMVGLGPTTAPAPSLIGANARAYLGVSPVFCFGPEISIFPYQETTEGYETSLIEANFNAHYVFEVAHRLGVYPLSGFNYTSERERLETNIEEIEKENALGINYGLGMHYSSNQVLFFAEFKGVISRLSDEFFTVGAIVLLERPKKKIHHEK